jgi:hypothetical protein
MSMHGTAMTGEDFRKSIQAGRDAVRNKRPSLTVWGLLALGVVEVVRFLIMHDVVGVIVYGAIFLVICPLVAICNDRRHRKISTRK